MTVDVQPSASPEPASPRLNPAHDLVAAFLATATSWAEDALTMAISEPERAASSLAVARIALTVARSIRCTGDREIRP